MDMDKESLVSGQIVPGKQHSFWIDTTADTNYPTFGQGVEVDVAILGGGMVGITAAILLKEAGKTVALIETDRIAKSVTGHTTAKATSLHSIIYSKLAGEFGQGGARIYADANQAALAQIASFVERKSIDCDFLRTPMYVYTESQTNVSQIQSEVQAAQSAGLAAAFVRETPLPFDIAGAIRLENQIQFHPLKYLKKLAEEIPGDGSHIFENARALDIKSGDPFLKVVTEHGTLKAKQVIVATHFPFYDTGLYLARLYPFHAYAIGVRINGEVPEGMYYTEDQNHFAIRNQPTKDGAVLIISGGHHKVGQGGDTMQYYEYLERLTRERFDVASIDSYWSTMDYESQDMVPFIGKAAGSERVYIASGFAGWGMSNGTLAAMILSDLILQRDNSWSQFFSPARPKPPQSFLTALTENINVGRQYVMGALLTPRARSLDELPKGEGTKMVLNRKDTAVYKDEEGRIFAHSPVCRHAGCIVNWNNAEKTWDCPCHGSRYDYDGKVIHGPTQEPLRKRNVTTGAEEPSTGPSS